MLAEGTKQSKKRLFILLGVGLILIISSLLIFNNLSKPKKEEVLISPEKMAQFEKLKKEKKAESKAEFTFTDVLEHPLFKKLQKYGDWPVKIEKKGRVNPFLPFFEE